MADHYLERASEEIAKARDEASDETVQEQLQERVDQLARMAQRGGFDTESDVLEDDPGAVRPIAVEAEGAVQTHVTEANKQLSSFRESVDMNTGVDG